MVTFFPTIYEGELLYSAISRYHARSGNINAIDSINDLFSKKYISLNKELPTGINQFINNMTNNCKYTEEEIINNHTLYKFYTAFLDNKLSQNIMNKMKYSDGKSIHILIGVKSIINRHNKLKFCPICMKEDIGSYGEPYWKVVHQAPGVWICHIHQEILYDSDIYLYDGINNLKLLSKNETINRKQVEYSNKVLSHLYSIALDIDYILKSNLEKREISWFRENYLNYLKKMNLATKDGRVKKRDLIEQFKLYYGDEILNILDSNIDYNDSYNWIIGLLGKRDNHINTLRHILFIRFLGISIDEIFSNKYEYKIFGDGPWPCLNCTCPYYYKDVIDKVNITYDYKSNKHIGTFACECGFTYTRQESDENDIYKCNRVKIFGNIWESKLIKLVNTKQFSLRQLAYKMNVDCRTIDRYAEKLKLETYWRQYDEDRYSKNIKPKTEKVVDYRLEWLKILDDNKGKSRTEIIEVSSSLYYQLYKNDREWLFNNMPESIRHTYKVLNTVDWNKRDYETLEKVKLCVSKILNYDGKPIRLTKNRIGTMLGEKNLLKRSINNMPRTKAYIESVEEDIKAFRVRRIKWAINELINNNMNLNVTNIRKLISFNPDSNTEELKNIIENEIENTKKDIIKN